jgi:pimeloyl-ACP methyl ester carboxylesterase
VFGTADPTVPPAVARRYAQLYGGRARLVPIQGAGHVFESAAWREELCRHSLEFIRQGGKP